MIRYGRDGIGDFVVDDANGEVRYIDSRYGGEFPAAGAERRVIDPHRSADRDSALSWRLMDFLEQASNLRDTRQILEAYGATYEPFVLSWTGIAAALSTATPPLTRRVPASWFVATQTLVGLDDTLSVDFTFEVTRSAGPIDLFDQPLHVGCLLNSGFAGGSASLMERRQVFRPQETLSLVVNNVSAAAALACDFAFAGYLVHAARGRGR